MAVPVRIVKHNTFLLGIHEQGNQFHTTTITTPSSLKNQTRIVCNHLHRRHGVLNVNYENSHPREGEAFLPMFQKKKKLAVILHTPHSGVSNQLGSQIVLMEKVYN